MNEATYIVIREDRTQVVKMENGVCIFATPEVEFVIGKKEDEMERLLKKEKWSVKHVRT